MLEFLFIPYILYVSVEAYNTFTYISFKNYSLPKNHKKGYLRHTEGYIHF